MHDISFEDGLTYPNFLRRRQSEGYEDVLQGSGPRMNNFRITFICLCIQPVGRTYGWMETKTWSGVFGSCHDPRGVRFQNSIELEKFKNAHRLTLGECTPISVVRQHLAQQCFERLSRGSGSAKEHAATIRTIVADGASTWEQLGFTAADVERLLRQAKTDSSA